MRNNFYPAAMALLAVACTEPTAPNLNMPSAPPQVRSTLSAASVDFSSGAVLPAGYSLTPTNTDVAPNGQKFLGRFRNESVIIGVPAEPGPITVAFDLYIIGSWDGFGGRKYGTDSWEIAARCQGSIDVLSAFRTDFSNKVTTQQHYPNADDGELNAGLAGSTERDALGYSTLSGGPTRGKGSSADATYAIRFTLPSNNCVSGVEFVLRSPTQQLQETSDESWGVDNLQVSGG